jgi:hypothetical protein
MSAQPLAHPRCIHNRSLVSDPRDNVVSIEHVNLEEQPASSTCNQPRMSG